MSLSKRMTAVMIVIIFAALIAVFIMSTIFMNGIAADLESQGMNLSEGLSSLKWRIGLSALVIMAIAAAVVWFIVGKQLSEPIKEMVEETKFIARGRTDKEINATLIGRSDEIGEVFKALDDMRKSMVAQTMIVEKLAMGKTDIKVEIRSDKEKLNLALIRLKENIEASSNVMKQMGRNVRYGKITKKEDLSELEGIWKEYPLQLEQAIEVFVKIFDSLPLVVAAFNKDYDVEFMNKTGEAVLGKPAEELMGTKCYNSFKTDQCNTEDCACRQAMGTNQVVREETISRAGAKPMDIDYIGVPLENENGAIVGAFEIVLDQTQIKTAQRKADKQADFQAKELEKLLKNLDRMSKGDLNINATVAVGDADTKIIEMTFQSISENLNNSVNEIKSYIDEIATVLSEMAAKNMTVGIDRNYLGDFVQLKESINHILSVFNETLAEIEQAAVQVETGTNHVAESSQNLSQGSAEQASSVEEISATITQIAEQTKQNASNANNANDISIGVKVDANEGNDKMTYMLQAMEDIKASSNNISNIIKVIDDIAFQTNILALNAAVEAARAGEHGKGFAVVAEEVRNLAARSASAAKETTEMIDLSINKVNEGYTLANETAKALQKIVTGVEETVNIVETIAEASIQQATAVSQIDDGINQISQVTQMNTSTAEESASASEQMASQAQYLKAMINEFKLKNNL